MYSEFLITFLLAAIVLFFVVLFVLNPLKSSKNSPPGPNTFPIFGNVVQIAAADSKNPYTAFEKLAKVYGNVMSLWFGVHHMVILSSYEAMKEILIKQETNWERLVFPFVPDRAFGNVERGIIWNYGESWHELKTWSLRTLRNFGFGKRNSMDVVMREEIAELISIVKEQLSDKSCVGNFSGVWKLDFQLLSIVSWNILWNFVAGHRFSLKDEKLGRAVDLNDRCVHAFGLTNRYAAFPWVKEWFPKWSQHEEHLKCYADITHFFREILQDMKSKKVGKTPENFIEAFWHEMDCHGDNHRDFNEEQLIVILQDFFLAGSETTSVSIAWIILYLALHPKEQQKVFEEVGTFGEDPISLNDEQRLIYTKAFIYEVIRLSPTVPSPGPRAASADIKLENGFVIPKGAGILYNLIPVFKDESYWGNPTDFKPQRFISEDGSKLVNLERMNIFGWGRRLCLGESLAWNTIILATSIFVKEFEISVVAGQQKPTVEPKVAGTLSPQPFSVFLRSRK